MKSIEELLEKLFTTDENLTCEEKQYLENILKDLDDDEHNLHKSIYKIGLLLDYSHLKEIGKTKDELNQYLSQDDKTIKSAEEYLNNHLELKNNMFGYPANMYNDTYTIKYLRYLESQLYLINGCGGSNDRGNYQMDNKDVELKIIELFMNNLNINKNEYWGYITSGGTEGNFWGIKNGFGLFPNGILYYSKDAHYSVDKFANKNGLKIYPNKIINSNNGKINFKDLIEKCQVNWINDKSPAIILLSWGTTKTGAIDDVELIEKGLAKLEIPHYIHLDAALYGGIPNNQVNAPTLSIFPNLNVDSVSISLHKYVGSPKVNGVVIAKNKNKSQFIDYIGQEDSTLLGSRDFLPFLTYQRVVDLFQRTNENEYQENVNYFMNEAKKNELPFTRENQGNIFIIEKPSDKICIKYQLATFCSGEKQLAHIIIFPSHKKENILSLIKDIVNEKEKGTFKSLKKNNSL